MDYKCCVKNVNVFDNIFNVIVNIIDRVVNILIIKILSNI